MDPRKMGGLTDIQAMQKSHNQSVYMPVDHGNMNQETKETKANDIANDLLGDIAKELGIDGFKPVSHENSARTNSVAAYQNMTIARKNSTLVKNNSDHVGPRAVNVHDETIKSGVNSTRLEAINPGSVIKHQTAADGFEHQLKVLGQKGKNRAVTF